MYAAGKRIGSWLSRQARWEPLARMARSNQAQAILAILRKRWFWLAAVPAAWLAFGPGPLGGRVMLLVLAAFIVSSRLQAVASRVFSAFDRPRGQRARGRRSSGKRAGKAIGKLAATSIMALVSPRRRSRKGTNIYKSWGSGG